MPPVDTQKLCFARGVSSSGASVFKPGVAFLLDRSVDLGLLLTTGRHIIPIFMYCNERLRFYGHSRA
jgi:hypothetical protein